MAVHFGLFYTVGALQALEASGGCISLPELEEAVVAHKLQRRRPERGKLDGEQMQRAQQRSKEERERRGERREGSDQPKPARRKRRPTLASAFWSGLTTQVEDEQARTAATERVRRALAACGFVEERADSALYKDRAEWTIHMAASKSYTYTARLDHQLRVMKLTERWLHWVSATLLAGEGAFDPTGQGTRTIIHEHSFRGKPCIGFTPTYRALLNCAASILDKHDLRIKVQTAESIPEDDPDYRKILKESDTPLLRIGEDGNPIANCKKVSMVRHVQARQIFIGPDGLKAEIAVGSEWAGSDLEGPKCFAELSLETDLPTIRELVALKTTRHSAGQWLVNVLNVAIALSEALRKGN
jgi:hypothetical protein